MSPILGSIGAMSESSYRGNLDDYANDFSFTNVDNANPGTLYTSGIATITGINYKIKVSVVGAGASFSVNGDAFSTSPRFMRNGNEIRLALTTAQDFTISDFLKEYNVNVTAGKRTTTWTVKTRAINHNLVPFNFTPVTNLPVGVAITSNSVSISGLEPGYGLPSGVNGFGARISINGGVLDTSGIVFNGNYFYINNPAASAAEQSSYNQTRNISAFVGTYSTTWSVVTESADLTPDAFSFTSITGVEINTSFVSNSITVSGINSVTVPKFTLNISIFGSGFEYSKNGGTFTSQVGTVVSGDVIQLRKTTDSNYSTTFTGTLVIGSVSSSWNVTTKSQPFDTIPNTFSFTSRTNVARNTSFTSNQIALSGMTPGFFGSASVSGSGQFRVIRNGITVSNFSTNSVNVQLGDVIDLRDTSSLNYSTTKTTNFTVSGLDINGNPGETSALWNVTTEIAPIPGCTDPTASNYNPAATQDNGTCIFPVPGCTNSRALNYNPAATVDNGTCIPIVLGCTNSTALNYNPAANVDNGTCTFTPVVNGCTDPTALNYNPTATVDDGSCIPIVLGCTNPAALNYNPAANVDNGTCTFPPILPIQGCTNPTASNYNPAATVDDDTCIFPCVVPTRTSIYGTGFLGYLKYNNGGTNLGDFLTGSKDFITGLNSSYSGTIPERTQFTYQNVSSRIINTYLNTVGRYPEADGYDFWINAFRYESNTYYDLNALEVFIILTYQKVGGEKFYQISKDRLNGNFDFCDVRRTNEIAAIPGCTTPTASNYNQQATQDDGSCIQLPPTPTPVIPVTPPCIVPTRTSTYGTGFQGYLRYGNGEEIPASNGSDSFMIGLNSSYSGIIITAGGVTTTYEQISNTIISAYENIIRRYPDAIGYDYWVGDFISNSGYTNLNILYDAIVDDYNLNEGPYQTSKGGLVGNYDFCDVKRV